MTYTEETIGRASLPEPIDVDELRSGVRGQVFVEGDDGYEEAARIWNGAHDGRRPALVTRCSGPADVIAALGFARGHDLEIAVRGGGHSIAGFSTGDGVAVIDLSEINEVHVERGTTVRPERNAASNRLIHDLATRCAVVQVPPTTRSSDTPKVRGPPGSNG